LDLNRLTRFLALSKKVKGIGVSRARDIAERFGENRASRCFFAGGISTHFDETLTRGRFTRHNRPTTSGRL